MVKLNLTSQIVLNKVPQEFYQPKTAVDRTELTRMEKIPTNIFPTIEEGARHIANGIEYLFSTNLYAVIKKKA